MAPFVSPPDPPAFNALVWEIVRRIPPGRVAAYGQIARQVPPPEGVDAARYRAFGARWVGGAMAACPEDVPWWRVVNAQGKISLRGSDARRQRELLEAEGMVFDARGRVDLEQYAWGEG